MITSPAIAIAASPDGATESGTTVTITTAAPHGFAVGEQITVAGVGGVGYSGYNGMFTVATAGFPDDVHPHEPRVGPRGFGRRHRLTGRASRV